MAEPVQLALTGAQQGTITGDGPAGAIQCFAFDAGGEVSRDAGGAFGRRTYEPLAVTKRLDDATPMIATAFVNGEQLSATFTFTRRVGGSVETFFTIAIAKARVVSTHSVLPDTLEPRTASLVALERVGFVFDHIEWTSTTAGRAATDDGILA